VEQTRNKGGLQEVGQPKYHFKVDLQNLQKASNIWQNESRKQVSGGITDQQGGYGPGGKRDLVTYHLQKQIYIFTAKRSVETLVAYQA